MDNINPTGDKGFRSPPTSPFPVYTNSRYMSSAVDLICPPSVALPDAFADSSPSSWALDTHSVSLGLRQQFVAEGALVESAKSGIVC